MSGTRRALLAVLGLGAVGTIGMIACEAVPLTAPAGTEIFLLANPSFVPANGGRSLVTAVLTEPAGTFVPDGTEVFFFTSLGTIEERVKTVDGIARTYFVSDARSGTAQVTAMSGGKAPPTTPTTTLKNAPTLDTSATGTGSASVTIDIGTALPANLLLTANPSLLASSRQAEIVANVFDERGNPVQNVPVFFKVEADPLQEFLASGGAPRFTNSSGQAFDTLSTRAPNGLSPKDVTVTATAPAGAKTVTGTVTVVVMFTP